MARRRDERAEHRTGQHIYAQIIDDAAGKTLAAASTLGGKASGANVAAAAQVGKDIAAAAKRDILKVPTGLMFTTR